MDTKHKTCSIELIERFLGDDLSAKEAAEFENHLESCPACRRELDARAADEDWWSQARDCLAESGLSSLAHASNAEPMFREGTRSWEGRSAEPTAEIPTSSAAIRPYLAPTDDPRMLGRVGPYEIVGVVGSGGNGIVLKGFDAALHRYVAIKLLSPRLADSGAARRRFSREAQAAAAVVHDNVMAIHAVAETAGLPYLVMPYVRGPSLEKRLRSAGPLAVEEILRVGMQVAAGLAAAHAQGLIHRDIKPANIMLEEGTERVKITDFGLARAADDASLTRSGVIAGTPQYMSPEQARGEPVDHRTDLFSLGCLLYAACTGRSPFRADTAYGVLRKICESEPRPIREINPAVPDWLVRIIDRLLAKDPSQRYASAAEVAALLERCLAHVQQPATVALPDELIEPTHGASPRAWLSRIGRRGALAAAVIMVLAVAILATQRSGRPTVNGPGTVGDRPEQTAVRRGSPDPAGGSTAGLLAQRTGRPSVNGPGTVGDRPDRPTAWEDGADEKIEALGAEVEQLRGQGIDDLWNDTLGVQIEQLRNDAENLAAQLDPPGESRTDGANPIPQTPTKETKP
ncbi:MAG: protein kinase domain-containing protein [Pirellulales bacterium]